MQSIPRTVLFDVKTRSNLLQWPVDEVEQLRMNSTTYTNITIDTASYFRLSASRAAQVCTTYNLLFHFSLFLQENRTYLLGQNLDLINLMWYSLTKFMKKVLEVCGIRSVDVIGTSTSTYQ